MGRQPWQTNPRTTKILAITVKRSSQQGLQLTAAARIVHKTVEHIHQRWAGSPTCLTKPTSRCDILLYILSTLCIETLRQFVAISKTHNKVFFFFPSTTHAPSHLQERCVALAGQTAHLSQTTVQTILRAWKWKRGRQPMRTKMLTQVHEQKEGHPTQKHIKNMFLSCSQNMARLDTWRQMFVHSKHRWCGWHNTKRGAQFTKLNSAN